MESLVLIVSATRLRICLVVSSSRSLLAVGRHNPCVPAQYQVLKERLKLLGPLRSCLDEYSNPVSETLALLTLQRFRFVVVIPPISEPNDVCKSVRIDPRLVFDVSVRVAFIESFPSAHW